MFTESISFWKWTSTQQDQLYPYHWDHYSSMSLYQRYVEEVDTSSVVIDTDRVTESDIFTHHHRYSYIHQFQEPSFPKPPWE